MHGRRRASRARRAAARTPARTTTPTATTRTTCKHTIVRWVDGRPAARLEARDDDEMAATGEEVLMRLGSELVLARGAIAAVAAAAAAARRRSRTSSRRRRRARREASAAAAPGKVKRCELKVSFSIAVAVDKLGERDHDSRLRRVRLRGKEDRLTLDSMQLARAAAPERRNGEEVHEGERRDYVNVATSSSPRAVGAADALGQASTSAKLDQITGFDTSSAPPGRQGEPVADARVPRAAGTVEDDRRRGRRRRLDDEVPRGNRPRQGSRSRPGCPACLGSRVASTPEGAVRDQELPHGRVDRQPDVPGASSSTRSGQGRGGRTSRADDDEPSATTVWTANVQAPPSSPGNRR